MRRRWIRMILGCVGLLSPRPALADLTHDAVSGTAVHRVRLEALESPNANAHARDVDWSELANPKTPGLYAVRFPARGEAVQIPHCNGRERILIDGAVKDPGSKGPAIVRLPDDASHEITVEIKASTYEKRLACSAPPRVGPVVRSTDGLVRLRFSSPHAAKGGGEAVLLVPGGHDRTRPATLLVGTHPWNGTPWTYAAYAELLEEAGKRDVVLLMPNGLGNSLYVAEAEDEVMRAIDAASSELAIDRRRVSIWGASMGGAGATTIAFHHPDRFAFVASYFGDSRYDLTTYVRGILGGEDGARKVNALGVLENARWLPVFLVHGEDDHTSPMRQSTMLEAAMKKAGFSVELVRVPGMGHEGPLVVRHIREVVARASAAVAPEHPARVSFRSVRAEDVEAYGVRIVRDPTRAGDTSAFIDIERSSSSANGTSQEPRSGERKDGAIHVLAAEGIAEVVLAKDALGSSPSDSVIAPNVRVRWAP